MAVSREPLQLRVYWTTGPGAAKWVGSPTPYTALVAALRKAGVPEHEVHGLAASLFKAVFGIYPGQREGKAGGRHG